MDQSVFLNIGKIIERDSKTTTYKLALLRSVIEIIQENSPYIRIAGDRVHMPTGLLVLKWMTYYYPILESEPAVPQINGAYQLAFEGPLRNLIQGYKHRGGFSRFYNDLTVEGIPGHLMSDFVNLVNQLRNTITRMPMRYIGRTLSNDYYSIFCFTPGRSLNSAEVTDKLAIIEHSGSFSIPLDYFEAFRFLGSFINGQDSILMKWAEFSARASGDNISVAMAIDAITRSPVTDRDVQEAKRLYSNILQEEKSVYCIWTGQRTRTYQIDHLLPFAIMKNNDLWNLLPSTGPINRQKRDKIPSPDVIEKSRERILYYWNLIHEKQEDRFDREMKLALLGPEADYYWQDMAIGRLQEACHYLITNRGYEEWKPAQ